MEKIRLHTPSLAESEKNIVVVAVVEDLVFTYGNSSLSIENRSLWRFTSFFWRAA